jgi:uncharacterized membrane protein YidH (DUF202 family)
VVAGVCFALYGVAVIAYGSARRRTVETALAEGRFPSAPRLAHAALALGGIVLGLFTVVLILLD